MDREVARLHSLTTSLQKEAKCLLDAGRRERANLPKLLTQLDQVSNILSNALCDYFVAIKDGKDTVLIVDRLRRVHLQGTRRTAEHVLEERKASLDQELQVLQDLTASSALVVSNLAQLQRVVCRLRAAEISTDFLARYLQKKFALVQGGAGKKPPDRMPKNPSLGAGPPTPTPRSVVGN